MNPKVKKAAIIVFLAIILPLFIFLLSAHFQFKDQRLVKTIGQYSTYKIVEDNLSTAGPLKFKSHGVTFGPMTDGPGNVIKLAQYEESLELEQLLPFQFSHNLSRDTIRRELFFSFYDIIKISQTPSELYL